MIDVTNSTKKKKCFVNDVHTKNPASFVSASLSCSRNCLLAHLEYYLGLLDDAERSIAHAIELGHTDDGSMQVRLARINVRRHNADTSNSQRDLRAALASFYEALKFRRVESQAVHYLEVSQFVAPPRGVNVVVRNTCLGRCYSMQGWLFDFDEAQWEYVETWSVAGIAARSWVRAVG